MAPSPMLSKMQLVFAILDDVLERRLVRTVTSEDSKLLINFISKLVITRRMYLLRTDSDANELWQLIGQHEALVDFVMNLSVELALWLDLSEINSSQLVLDLATSFGRHAVNTASGVIPRDTLDRFPTSTQFATLCKNNPWLLGLVLISLRGMSVIAKIPTLSADVKPGSAR